MRTADTPVTTPPGSATTPAKPRPLCTAFTMCLGDDRPLDRGA
ncbi:hypothetical protein AB0D27_36300 [Streptomyces sp. NPDC048415]